MVGLLGCRAAPSDLLLQGNLRRQGVSKRQKPWREPRKGDGPLPVDYGNTPVSHPHVDAAAFAKSVAADLEGKGA